MKNDIKGLFAEKVQDFRLPAYSELPSTGLYLEQVTKYINGLISPLGFAPLTPSMISNYVKKGVIDSPVKKQYYAEHIAYLIFVGMGKNVVSIDEISYIYDYQKTIYPCDVAYDYFCTELLNVLRYNAGLQDEMENVGTTNTELKLMLRSVIICLSHLIFVTESIREFKRREEDIGMNNE
ncbi:MAG: DUF1836 domain-containing protein [Clostridia bacterium]|nr:DUF1836 domain-containing protein [Clostridia bacterium]